MKTVIVGYENSNFTVTKINSTLEEAKRYYIGNIFNINEKLVTAVTCELWNEWKNRVYEYCIRNFITILKFDDENEIFYFKASYNDYLNVSYNLLNKTMDKVYKDKVRQ